MTANKQFFKDGLLNVKILSTVCSLTFMSMMNTASENLNARKSLIFALYSRYEQLKFHAQLR